MLFAVRVVCLCVHILMFHVFLLVPTQGGGGQPSLFVAFPCDHFVVRFCQEQDAMAAGNDLQVEIN